LEELSTLLGAIEDRKRGPVGAARAPRTEDLIALPSQEMAELSRRLREVAGHENINVFIEGETGTGKNVAARMLHDSSPRAGRPFVQIHCADLREAQLASALFGFEAEAIADPAHARPGILERARGGTLVFNEIGAMPLGTQVHLLTMLAKP